MRETQERSRRQGGREARKRLRAAPQPEADKPVQPGLEGGRYAPLDAAAINRIHEAALEVLETIGLANAIPSCVELVTQAGGIYTDAERLLFPRALVEDTLASAARNITLHGRDPRHDMELSGKRVHFGTAGAAVHIVDPVTREYRESTLKDLYDFARIVESLDHVHFFQRPLVARDMVEPADLDFNT
ncbi:MAG: trimethylamine methyltransferase family protein, partial [Gammaproteobacteria bacterium]